MLDRETQEEALVALAEWLGPAEPSGEWTRDLRQAEGEVV